ncbi:MAG TPA: ABC transporter permease subunit [Lacisediminihabitans sp.]|uniref:ABC transporter permease n=1 Tax=Lacisediminihabitans sp. TaxID=2787631 RepID=UPI002ED9E97C
MNLILQGLQWIFDPAHWSTGGGTVPIGARIGEHLYYTGVSLLVTVLIAVPLGLVIGHTGRGRGVAIVVSNAARALPTLGLYAALLLALGFGLAPIAIVLVILGIPPLLAGVYAGIESVDPQTVDAARAMGMTESQILFTVEIPLGLALILGGFRSAALQLIATVTIAGYFGFGGGLGHYLTFGLSQNDYPQMVAGAILVIALALAVDGILAVIQRFAVPRVSRGTTGTARRGAIPSPAQTRALIKEGQ